MRVKAVVDGSFFGNVYVGASKQLFLRVVYIFYDGADGISEHGTYKLSIVDASQQGSPLVFIQYPTETFVSGENACQGLCAYHVPALKSDGPQDEAGHVYYDVVKTWFSVAAQCSC